MLDKDKIIRFIKTYLPDAEPDVINKLAEELDEDITPYVCTFIRKIIELDLASGLRR
ncbi:MAG: hypothetical protein P4N41_09680 [Negativicutes bacterium]|nr:hypothetical protein [Negativicutes bacterium]